jgi:hypothetical protein
MLMAPSARRHAHVVAQDSQTVFSTDYKVELDGSDRVLLEGEVSQRGNTQFDH